MIKLTKTNVSLFIVLLLIIDQISKIWIKTNMTINESFRIFGNWFYIRFIENPGAAFGFELGGDYGKMALSLIRIVAVCVLVYYIVRLLRKHAPKGVIIGFALIFAGAMGNIIDSLFYGMIFSESTFMEVATMFPEGGGYSSFLHGKVVDMLYFPIIETTYPVWFPGIGGEEFVFFSPIFNLADTYISVGFLYLLFFQRKFFK